MQSEFVVRRFLKDFASWEQAYRNSQPSAITSTQELVSLISNNKSMSSLDAKKIKCELVMWMDVTMDEMVASFRKQQIDVKHMLLFMKENQDRYFERGCLVKCHENHVVGIFPIYEGVDGGTDYCPYCERDVEMPLKIYQEVVYNWK